MLDPTLPVQLLQQSKICPLSVSHIRRTRQTSPQWLSCLRTAQRGDGRQVSQIWRTQAVHEWLRSRPKDFFSRGIHALPKHWDTCMVRNGDYVEKWSHCVPIVFSKLRDKKYLRFSFDSPTYIFSNSNSLSTVCLVAQLGVNVVSWNSIFLIFQVRRDYDPLREWQVPTEKERQCRNERPDKVAPFPEGMSTSPQLSFYLGFSPFNWRIICTMIVLLLIF